MKSSASISFRRARLTNSPGLEALAFSRSVDATRLLRSSERATTVDDINPALPYKDRKLWVDYINPALPYKDPKLWVDNIYILHYLIRTLNYGLMI